MVSYHETANSEQEGDSGQSRPPWLAHVSSNLDEVKQEDPWESCKPAEVENS
jgi:hypothetical protein